MSWERPDPPRDEDRYYEDESMVPSSLLPVNEPARCPTCDGWNPAHTAPPGEHYCTPIRCSAWTFTARLTKQGPKPIRPDGRADLKPASLKEEVLHRQAPPPCNLHLVERRPWSLA